MYVFIYSICYFYLFFYSSPCQLLENVPETVVHVLISMMNVHPTGNAAHSMTVTKHKHPKSVPQLPL